MNVKKLLAIVLAVLMVIPALVVPTAAEETDPYTVHHEFTQWDASEEPYFVQHGKGDPNNSAAWAGRNGEENGTIWKFALNNPSDRDGEFNALKSFTVTAETRNELVISLSLDNGGWAEAYSVMTDPNLEVDDARWCLDPKVRTYDLTTVLSAMLMANPAAEYVYVKLGDVAKDVVSSVNGYKGVSGYGGCFLKRTPVKVDIAYDADNFIAAPGDGIIMFTPGMDDTTYKYGENGVNSNSTNFCLDEKPGDEPNYITYVYALTNSELPSKLVWKASIGQNLILDFSVDNFHWAELCNDVVGDVVTSEYRTFDITEAYAAEVAKYPSNMLYIRLRNSRPGQDFGGRIDKFPVMLEIEYPEREVSGEQINFEYTVRGESEKPYLVGAPSTSGTTGYFADRLAEIKYRFPLSDADTSSEILLTATNCNKFDIQVSVDDVNWVTAFKYSDVGLNAGLSDHPKPNQTIYDKKERTFDLTAAVKAAGELADAQGNLKSMLLFRVVNAHPYLINADGTLNTSKTTGWGGQIHGNVKLSIRMSSDMSVAAEASRVIMEDVSPNDTTYQFVGQEPMLVSASEAGHVASLSQNINASKVDTETMTTTGDGNWNGRYGDNGAYWVYRYELSASAKSFAWQATVGGQYGIYVAYGDENCPDVKDTTQWTLVKDYMSDGAAAADTPNPVAMTISDEITAEKLAKGGYVYLLFTDYSWWRTNVTCEDEADAKSGYGPRVCLGSNYPVTMSYIVSIEAERVSAGMQSVALNLTEEFNLIYIPRIPMSSKDAVIEIGFKGETMSVVEPEEDGTYRFDDILPQRMGDTIVFRMNGTIASLTDYSYELEYSVKQYCMNMLGEKADDAELCQLLRDILSYGAAVQSYNGYKADELVNNGITDRDFYNGGLRGVYAGTIEGEGKAAEWVSASLKLENITEVVFKFRADDVTDLKAVITKNTGEKMVFDAADFSSAGVDENGKQLWSVSIPMMACEYHTGMVATFAKAGTEDADMNHYLVYSVNTYISKMYGQGDAALNTLLGAIYNYGESTLEYVAALNK